MLTAISTIDIICVLAIPAYAYPWFAALIRPILMGFMIRTIREQWRRYIFVILDSAEMVIFIAVYIIYFSWIGLRLFKGTIEGISYFDSFGDACFNMLVLMTTSNYPDVMMPAYR